MSKIKSARLTAGFFIYKILFFNSIKTVHLFFCYNSFLKIILSHQITFDIEPSFNSVFIFILPNLINCHFFNFLIVTVAY